MATKNVVQPATSARLHELAHLALREIASEREEIFSVASGGAAFAGGSENLTEAKIFHVIEKMLMSSEDVNTLRKLIDELGNLAGSTFVAEASHG